MIQIYEWLELLKRHPFCHYCGRRLDAISAEPDHLIPLARDGEDSIVNVVPACKRCNRIKSDRTESEFRSRRWRILQTCEICTPSFVLWKATLIRVKTHVNSVQTVQKPEMEDQQTCQAIAALLEKLATLRKMTEPNQNQRRTYLKRQAAIVNKILPSPSSASGEKPVCTSGVQEAP